ncbi:MAG: hypothetical protein Q7W45_01635 [Bacteroidota bacterium]|nr:hypothetical protein [Bacteroidota bacterium]MDP3144544.1 hypothetical protein [Bacteroidota bacterium]MDP3555787.1 hypothetical protein [Bacteroidota bacterium]
MQDSKIWIIISKHLSAEETPQESRAFLEWINESEKNQELFYNTKKIWESVEINQEHSKTITLREKFSKKKIKEFIIKQAIGNFIGFIIGMWVTVMFSHHVLERRGLKNLFGLAGRKKVVVNDVPEWLQGLLSIIVGFIALELVNHFFQTKKHLFVRDYILKIYKTLKTKIQRQLEAGDV